MRVKPKIEVIRVPDVEAARDFGVCRPRTSQGKLAPEAGLEPATRRLTAGCSTIELLWNPKSMPPVNPDPSGPYH
jgi:hypothetical protein